VQNTFDNEVLKGTNIFSCSLLWFSAYRSTRAWSHFRTTRGPFCRQDITEYCRTVREYM